MTESMSVAFVASLERKMERAWCRSRMTLETRLNLAKSASAYLEWPYERGTLKPTLHIGSVTLGPMIYGVDDDGRSRGIRLE